MRDRRGRAADLLQGPVAAGAAILPQDCQILYLDDSKSSLRAGEELFLEIPRSRKRSPGRWGSWVLSGSMRSTSCRRPRRRCARRSRNLTRHPRSFKRCGDDPGHVDPQVPIIKGDAKSVSIAAASILAEGDQRPYDGRSTIRNTGVWFCKA